MADNADLNLQEEAGEPTSTRLGNVRWTICAMLFAATTINYMDRTVLGLLKPTLMQTVANHGIGLTEESYGTVVAFFTLFYAIGLLAAGRFVDKVGTRIGYMVIMGLWSLSAMGHALVNSVFQLGVARACLGVGESGNFPAANKTVAEWFPQRERALATGIYNSGANIGVILAALIVPVVVMSLGWHYAFLVTGLFSMTWILVWFLKYRRPIDHSKLSATELAHINQDPPEKPTASLPWIKLLGIPQTWAFSIPKGLTDPIWWFYLYWLPDFFSKQYHLDLKHLGLPLIVVYTASSVGSIGGGWLPSYLIRLGMTAERARMSVMLFFAVLVVPVFLINYLDSEWVAISLLSLAAAAHQGWSANLFTTASDMFPRKAVGSVTGIGAMAGAVTGFCFAKLAGHLLQVSNSYAVLFIIAASVYLVSWVFMVLLAPGLKKVEVAL
jgi:ACS family hexuronate transporter-like MFS transporter